MIHAFTMGCLDWIIFWTLWVAERLMRSLFQVFSCCLWKTSWEMMMIVWFLRRMNPKSSSGFVLLPMNQGTRLRLFHTFIRCIFLILGVSGIFQLKVVFWSYNRFWTNRMLAATKSILLYVNFRDAVEGMYQEWCVKPKVKVLQPEPSI